ncbi:MAG: 30S ribosomal protein S27ae [Nanoarchaeota archaeon]|nr:30S ribosomal protein S27ae [Nanoarchaeota archaeon]MBU1103856.1 30S ribosomal protein S27ae [Nanoarchaeota archaeon]
MAKAKGGSKKDRKGKKPHKNKKTSKKYSHYENGKTNKKHCPRCGPGTFLADNKNRIYCGKCHYTEFTEKKE